jgi:hypothetical protein
MLLPICHDNTEFGGVVLDRMLPTIHRAAVEDNHISGSTSMVQGHGKEDLRPDCRSQPSVPYTPESGSAVFVSTRRRGRGGRGTIGLGINDDPGTERSVQFSSHMP